MRIRDQRPKRPAGLAFRLFATAAIFALFALPARTEAAQCGHNGEGFESWLETFRQEAAGAGISQRAIEASLSGVAYDRSVVSRDHGQGVFRQSFEQFSGRMINSYRLSRGRALLQRHAGLFQQIERRYGVPGAVLVAIWGLETDFGAGNGNFPTIRSLATLAYDCRRAPMFRQELLDALRIVERGDLAPSQMRGAWAGEIGQMQFMPSSYLKFGVDFNGDGSVDLIHDSADALASTANFLRGYGWQSGAGWDEGQPNFGVLLQWNKARVYSKTIALFADKLAGRAADERPMHSAFPNSDE